jgi:hypothetical protein
MSLDNCEGAQQKSNMAEHIIVPPQSWWERLKGDVKEFSPQVKAAMITVCGTLTVTAIVTMIGWLSSSSENSRLKEKIHGIELESLPFKILAVQEFNKADVETMKRLADLMTKLQKDYTNQLDTINTLRGQVDGFRKTNSYLLTRFERVEPRRITDEQHNMIVSLLKSAPKGKTKVSWQGGVDREAEDLAGQIIAILSEAGYSPESVDVGLEIRSDNKLIGIQFWIKDRNHLPPHLAPIVNSFTAAKIPIGALLGNNPIDEDMIEIRVGSKAAR